MFQLIFLHDFCQIFVVSCRFLNNKRPALQFSLGFTMTWSKSSYFFSFPFSHFVQLFFAHGQLKVCLVSGTLCLNYCNNSWKGYQLWTLVIFIMMYQWPFDGSCQTVSYFGLRTQKNRLPCHLSNIEFWLGHVCLVGTTLFVPIKNCSIIES